MSAVRSTSRAADLYERHRGSVFGYCLSRLGRREDAEDAVQTTFVHAVRGLRRGVVPESEPAWLLGIARNVCLSRRDRAARRRRLEEACDPAELERVARADDERHEELIGLPDALRRLPAQQRAAILLRDWRGLSYDEVARELGVSRAAVETLIFRGRDALAELLRDEPRKGRRRRLALLGNVGSALAAAKDSLAGGAAVTKLAATGAAAVAVVGSGVAVDAVLADGAPAPRRPSPATTASQPARPASTPATETLVRPTAAGKRPAAPAPPVVAEAAAATTPAPVDAPAPTPAATAPSPPAPAATPDEPVASSPAPPPAPAKPKPTAAPPAAPEPLPAVETAVASTTTSVEETAAKFSAAVEETVATVEETVAAVPATVDAVVAPVEKTVAETAAQTTGLLPAEPAAPIVPALP